MTPEAAEQDRRRRCRDAWWRFQSSEKHAELVKRWNAYVERVKNGDPDEWKALRDNPEFRKTGEPIYEQTNVPRIVKLVRAHLERWDAQPILNSFRRDDIKL